MDDYGNKEVTEYLPDDPLDVSVATSLQRLHKIDHLLKHSNRSGAKQSIRVTKTNKKPNTIVCIVCTLTFPNRALLNLHRKTIHRQQFECYVCHKSFNRKSNLITHSRSHTPNIKPFRCKHCSLSFIRTTERLRHYIFHTGNTRNQCRQCKLVLSSQERLEKYKKTHVVSENFQCHMCGASGFESKKTLSTHIRLHAKICDKKFNGSPLTDVHTEKVDGTFDCDLCKKQFSRKSNFMAHVKRHCSNQTEDAKVKTHLCCICGKLFSYKTHLIRHLYVHNVERPFKCEYCGSDFTQYGGLMKHIEKHKRSN